MTKGARAMDAPPPPVPPVPDLGPLMLGPLTALRAWADMSRAASSLMPATVVIAMAPFFWAPPVWVGLLMAGQAARRGESQKRGGPETKPAPKPRPASRGFTTIGVSR
ncbi:hypothetical protein [Azospirillum sp.]|uniref:hypothetical protein n=1 Tax=Azospirillum sp. TaxID=34012 RepID=UPI003D75D392